MVMVPWESSTMRNRERTREDLPLGWVSMLGCVDAVGSWTYLPVRPTMATFSPGLMDSEKSWMTGSPGLESQRTVDTW
jgi:hypothetical protein